MTTFPRSPRLLRGGIALLDVASDKVLRVIALQYNPDTLSRTLAPQAVGGEGGGDRSQVLRLKGPPVETYKLEAEIDAADQMELGSGIVGQFGIAPQIAALETIGYPPVAQLQSNRELSQQGRLEIAPIEMPLTIFIWSQQRIVPVRLTDLSITEESFDPLLNPLRAKLSLSMRVLSVSDLGFDHRGSGLYLRYQQQKETLSKLNAGADFSPLGIGGIS